MRILALDTALEACSAALCDGEDVIARESIGMLRGHAEALIPLVQRVVGESGFEGIDRIAVTTGPGSFTGLRVAIAAARSFALALERPCVGISTLAAFAAPHLAVGDGQPVASVIDARHGHVYFQLFSSNARSMVEARCLPVREAARMLGGGTAKIVGPGAPLLALEATAVGASVSIVDPLSAPDIVWVAKLGALADPALALPTPLYLKPADATPQTSGRIARA